MFQFHLFPKYKTVGFCLQHLWSFMNECELDKANQFILNYISTTHDLHTYTCKWWMEKIHTHTYARKVKWRKKTFWFNILTHAMQIYICITRMNVLHSKNYSNYHYVGGQLLLRLTTCSTTLEHLSIINRRIFINLFIYIHNKMN